MSNSFSARSSPSTTSRTRYTFEKPPLPEDLLDLESTADRVAHRVIASGRLRRDVLRVGRWQDFTATLAAVSRIVPNLARHLRTVLERLVAVDDDFRAAADAERQVGLAELVRANERLGLLHAPT